MAKSDELVKKAEECLRDVGTQDSLTDIHRQEVIQQRGVGYAILALVAAIKETSKDNEIIPSVLLR